MMVHNLGFSDSMDSFALSICVIALHVPKFLNVTNHMSCCMRSLALVAHRSD